MRTLLLMDGSHAIYRAYHAIPYLSTRTGVATHAALGFTTMLLKSLRETKPTHAAVAFDIDGKGYRETLSADYKATRPPAPADLPPQFEMCHRVLHALNVAELGTPGYEADDLIATLARRCVKEGGWDVVIVSGDKDLLQLVVDPADEGASRVRVLDSLTGVDKWYSRADVVAKWGVPPEQVADVLALIGDKIDNVPGIKGVGEKTALGLLAEFGSLEAILTRAGEIKKPKLKELVTSSIDQVRLSRRLVELVDVSGTPPVESLEVKPLDEPAARALFTELEFVRLLKDLPRPPPTPPTGARELVQDAPALASLRARLEAAPAFGLKTVTSKGTPLSDELVGLAFAFDDGSAAYVPLAHKGASTDLFGAAQALAPADVLGALRGVLEDRAKAKHGHDLKRDLVALARRGVQLAGLGIDVELASYLLDATRREHGIETLARERLSWELPAWAALLGEGKKARPVSEAPEAAVQVAGGHAAAALKLAPLLEKDLRDEELWKLYEEVERPLIPALARMELVGIKLDVARLGEIGRDVDGQLAATLTDIYAAAGHEFNVLSLPQLGIVLFDELKLPVLRRGRSGPTIDQEVLEKLAEQHPLPAKIVDYRQLSKLKGTYVDALPPLVAADGRLHTTFAQAVAATGRLSSVDPNLQNIPIRTEAGRRVREAFVAEPGCVLISADYSQIELRLLAHISGDAVLKESFAQGEDVHTRTAAEVFGVAPADVSKEMRNTAKMINYAIAYGLSAYGLATRLDLPGAEAQAIIARYFERYAGVKRWLEETVARAKADGQLRTLFGRRRFFPDLASRNPAIRQGAERAAVNTPIQGSAADLLKLAVLRLEAALAREKLRSRLVLNVHDELIVEAPLEEQDAAMAVAKEAMVNAVTLDVPLVVDARAGRSWADVH